jgi:hypothetical protein
MQDGKVFDTEPDPFSSGDESLSAAPLGRITPGNLGEGGTLSPGGGGTLFVAVQTGDPQGATRRVAALSGSA